jgi:hypothetical protein
VSGRRAKSAGVGALALRAFVAAPALAWGCAGAEAAPPCAFGDDHVVAEAGARVEALDVAVHAGMNAAARGAGGARGGSAGSKKTEESEVSGATVVWSERGGAFARRVTAEGAVRGDAVRLGPPCGGGIAVASVPRELGLAGARVEAGRTDEAADAAAAADASGDAEALVACLRTARPEKDVPGGLSLYALGRNGRAWLVWQGGRGPGASVGAPSGAAIAVWQASGTRASGQSPAGPTEAHAAAGYARVLWQDAERGAPRVLRLDLPLGAIGAGEATQRRVAGATPELASTPGVIGGSPSLLARQGHVVATWAETAYVDGETVGRVVARRDDGPLRELATVRVDTPAPQIVWQPRPADAAAGEAPSGEASPGTSAGSGAAISGAAGNGRTVPGAGAGRFVLGYRDARSASDRPRLHLLALGPDLTPRGRPSRVARANGPGGPSLAACGRALLAAAPRTYYRDALIGLTRIDAALRRDGGEQQLYEDGRQLALAALRCTGEARALLVIGEHATSAHPEARVRATALRCAEAPR